MAAYACLDKDLEQDPSKLMMPLIFYIKIVLLSFIDS